MKDNMNRRRTFAEGDRREADCPQNPTEGTGGGSRKVTEAARLAGVSKRTLQYYDDLGLVRAGRNDRNERIYDGEALGRLWRVLFLRELGLTISEIAEHPDPEEDRAALRTLREHCEAEDRALRGRIALLRRLEETGLPPADREDGESFARQIEEILQGFDHEEQEK